MYIRDEIKKNYQLISDAIDALGINVPVTRVRVVGNRVELWTYGTGDKKVWEAEGGLNFEGLLVKDLRQLAKVAGIGKTSGLKKAELKEKLSLAAEDKGTRSKIAKEIERIKK